MRRRFLIALGSVALAGLGGFIWASTSLHVLRAALPGTPSVAFASAARGTVIEPFVNRAVDVLVPASVQDVIDGFSVWAYGGDENHDATLGYNRSQSVVAGWVYPWQTALSSGDTLVATTREIGRLLEAVAGIALNKVDQPHPTVIVELSDTPGPISLQGTVNENTFAFTYSLSGIADERDVGGRAVPPGSMDQKDLKVALPSTVLNYFPMDELNTMQGDIVSDLAFTKTLPDIVGEFEVAIAFGVHMGDDSGDVQAVGVVEGAESHRFSDHLEEWVAMERAYEFPIRQAFRLPDGTIGYELIPSPNVSAGFSTMGADGCQTTHLVGRQVWRCQASDVTVFGISYDATQILVADLIELSNTGSWQVNLPATYATHIPTALEIEDAPKIQGIMLTGGRNNSGQGAIIF